MREIIDTLEAQHRALEHLAGEVGQAYKAKDEPRLKDALGRMRRLLEAHLELERTQFYPAFVQAAERQANESTKLVATLFRDNMAVIASGLEAFFRRADQDALPLDVLGRELRTTLEILGKRMVDEEKTLHPLLRGLL